ncbi:MAG: ribosomal RNA small subunit methyltransferase A [Planctomycetaceae bacterium]|nr:ribosomal RNA small subunit methyltransferase A [Planctomycetaceae bacterium]
MKKPFQRPSKPSHKKKSQRKPPRNPQRVTSGDNGEEAVASTSATRQTTAYLKKLFSEVGFAIDTKKGQNFLVDLNLLDLLERSAEIQPDDIILEVGSGTAALTERLARAAFRVVTIEIDSRLATLAQDRLVDADNVRLVNTDVLARKNKLSPDVLSALDDAEKDRLAKDKKGRFLLVANLPYCVATPVISNLMLCRPFASATVTVQYEMAERMTALAGHHSYNALSVWIGSQCRSEIVRSLPPAAFWPRPKVDSAIVRLDLEEHRRSQVLDLPRFHTFLRNIFCHRRKVLRGVLISLAGGKKNPDVVAKIDTIYEKFDLERNIRAESIDPDTFVKIEREFSLP